MSTQPHIFIFGLGYVGLPLAIEFGKHFDTVGFDINQTRVNQLLGGLDVTLEVDSEQLELAMQLAGQASQENRSG